MENRLPPRIKDISGRRFGRLVACRFAGLTSLSRAKWECICDCGTRVVVAKNNLYSGHQKSCGCFRREGTAQKNLTHGRSSTREYCIWTDMIKRCENAANKSYLNYGGRGIKVSTEWRHDFARFLSDMGPAPSGYTIERADNNGDYEPANCRWIPRVEQNRNRRNTVRVTFAGETHGVAAWSRKTGIPYATLLVRLRRWSIARALSERVRGCRTTH